MDTFFVIIVNSLSCRQSEKIRILMLSLFGFIIMLHRPPEMAMNARFICAAASKIPIIADAGKPESLVLYYTCIPASSGA